MTTPARPLPSEVKALGFVSLLTDASSEMIYPLLPSFLTGVLRAGPTFVGAVEGVAEATSAAFKVVSGGISDRARRRKPLVLFGYSVSSLARPLVAIATAPWHVLALRATDRIGKGVRGAPRDALIAEVTDPADRGRAFGFHRSMDHAGAVVGPLVASSLLAAGFTVRQVFAMAAVPAALSVAAIVFGVKEPANREPPKPDSEAPAAPLGPAFWRYLAVLVVFTLGNSTDAFLLLRAQEAGVPLAAIPLLWSFHHVVKSGASTPGGAWADRVGRRRAIAVGFAIYAASYAGFAIAKGVVAIVALFAVYGLYFAVTEGAERALLASLAPAGGRGRAFGLYHATTGLALLPASLITGALWQSFGAATALLTGAALAAIACVALLTLVPEKA